MLIGSGNLYSTVECMSKEGNAMHLLSWDILDFLNFYRNLQYYIHSCVLISGNGTGKRSAVVLFK